MYFESIVLWIKNGENAYSETDGHYKWPKRERTNGQPMIYKHQHNKRIK